MDGARIVGFEVDFGVAPDFLDMGLEDEFTLIDDSSVSTVMGNVILGVPVDGPPGMGVRPYAAFGLGAIRTSASSRFALIDSSDTEFGWNVGAGAMGFMSEMIGLRGDLRYFRSMGGDFAASPVTDEIDDFSFWRLTGGVTFRWGGNNP